MTIVQARSVPVTGSSWRTQAAELVPDHRRPATAENITVTDTVPLKVAGHDRIRRRTRSASVCVPRRHSRALNLRVRSVCNGNFRREPPCGLAPPANAQVRAVICVMRSTGTTPPLPSLMSKARVGASLQMRPARLCLHRLEHLLRCADKDKVAFGRLSSVPRVVNSPV